MNFRALKCKSEMENLKFPSLSTGRNRTNIIQIKK